MRILHVNKFVYRRGGAESYMQEVASLQTEAGHEVAFFGMQHPANPPLTYQSDFPPLLELNPPPRSPAGKARAAARILWSTSALRGMEKVVEDFEPDVVHLHNIYQHLSPSVLRPIHRRRLAAVMTLHDYKLVCPKYTLVADGAVCEACVGGRFHQAVLKGCKDGSRTASALLALEVGLHTVTRAYSPISIFIAPSNFIATKMQAGGVFPERLRILHGFIDAARVTPKEEPGGSLVFAGRLYHEKGVDLLLDALADLPAATLDVIGDGPERPALEQRAQVRAPGRVRFHGRLSKDDVLTLTRAAAVAVLPARWHENHPISVLEAFACAVPVVASTLGGLPELVEPGVTGALVPPNDPVALSRVLARLLADPEGTLALGRSARRRAEERFTPEEHRRGLDAIYAEAMAVPRP